MLLINAAIEDNKHNMNFIICTLNKADTVWNEPPFFFPAFFVVPLASVLDTFIRCQWI